MEIKKISEIFMVYVEDVRKEHMRRQKKSQNKKFWLLVTKFILLFHPNYQASSGSTG